MSYQRQFGIRGSTTGGGGSAPPPPSTDETPGPAPERTPRLRHPTASQFGTFYGIMSIRD